MAPRRWPTFTVLVAVGMLCASEGDRIRSAKHLSGDTSQSSGRVQRARAANEHEQEQRGHAKLVQWRPIAALLLILDSSSGFSAVSTRTVNSIISPFVVPPENGLLPPEIGHLAGSGSSNQRFVMAVPKSRMSQSKMKSPTAEWFEKSKRQTELSKSRAVSVKYDPFEDPKYSRSATDDKDFDDEATLTRIFSFSHEN